MLARGLLKTFAGVKNIQTSHTIKRYLQADPKPSTSFVSRFKKKMEESYEKKKETMMKISGQQSDQAVIDLMKSTPEGEFNMTTLRNFYAKVKQDMEANSSTLLNLLPKQKQEYLNNLDQVKLLIKTFDSFDDLERQYPKVLKQKQFQRVADETGQDAKFVELFVRSCMSSQDTHEFIQRQLKNNIPIPSSMKKIYILMTHDPIVNKQRRRLQGGYLQYLYKEKDPTRTKRLPQQRKF